MPRHVAHVTLRVLADQRANGRLRIQECLQVGVLLGPVGLVARAAEGRNGGVLPSHRARTGKELLVTRIGAGIPAFDVVNTELIEALGNLELVLQR